MTADDLIKILDSLPQYVAYVYPGYITIYVYYFLKAKTLHDKKGIIIKSVVISYLYLLCIESIYKIQNIKFHAMLIATAIAVPYVVYQIQNLKCVMCIFSALGIQTRFETNEFDILDNQDNKAAWLKVYLKDTNLVYEGFLGEKELEQHKKQFITLKKYRKYMLNKNGKPEIPYIEQHDDCDEDKVVIFYENINRIEKMDLQS